MPTLRTLTPEQWPEIEATSLNEFLQEMGAKNPDKLYVEVHCVTPEEIRKINNQHRQKNEATDVLSFPLFSFEELTRQHNVPSTTEEIAPILLGTLVICQEVVDKRNHGLSWTLLHGLKHLFGFDHNEAGEVWFPAETN